MMPLLRRSTSLWCAWTLASAALLFIPPWPPFSWPELVACLGALCLGLHRSVRRETLLVLGLPAIALLVLTEGGDAMPARLAVCWTIFGVSVVLAARASAEQRELERRVGRALRIGDPDEAMARFEQAVEIELARARRHGRGFGILSLAPHPRMLLEGSRPGEAILRRLDQARQVDEIAGVLSDELHRYATIAPASNRVLCLVPELEESDADALIGRLAKAVEVRLGLEIETGRARFPEDALALSELLDLADQRRRSARLASVAPPPSEPGDETAPLRAEGRDG